MVFLLILYSKEMAHLHTENWIETEVILAVASEKRRGAHRFTLLNYALADARGRQGRPRGPNSFIFKQFSAKN